MMVDPDTARSRLEEERDRLRRLIAAGDEQHTRDLDGQDSELSSFDQHPGDMATELHDQQVNRSIQGDLESQLVEVEAALRRVQDGAYGRCAAGDHEIGDDRLEARPTARYCVQHQSEAESESVPGTQATGTRGPTG